MNDDPRNTEEPIDPLPGLLASVDQALKLAGEAARISKTHFDAYVEQGFSEKQALYLTAMVFKTLEAPE